MALDVPQRVVFVVALAALLLPGSAVPVRFRSSSNARRGAQEAATLPCAASGMCSVGKVQRWTGDVYPSAGLKACVAARSYRQEFLFITDTRANQILQLYNNLRNGLGYDHVAVLTTHHETCAHITRVEPDLGCAYSTQTFKQGQMKYLIDRTVFLARAIRLRTNVLMLDTDVIVLHDIYTYLKAPPLGKINMLAMRDGNGWLNSGVVYIQNARPDGAVAYIMNDIIDRWKRWGEDPSALAAHGHGSDCWEQTMYSDTILSAAAGRPMSYQCWFIPDDTQRGKDWARAHKEALRGNASMSAGVWITDYLKDVVEVPWPAALRSDPVYKFWPEKLSFESGEVHVPNTRGVWPPELGGPLYGPKRLNDSLEWMALLRQDAEPLWPDPDDPAQAEAGMAITERVAYMPWYLVMSWSTGGHRGVWDRSLMAPGASPPVAIAHFVHVPSGAINKPNVRTCMGHTDWGVSHKAHGGDGVFFASTARAIIPSVLAYAPEVEAREWASEDEFSAAVLALARVAFEMGRSVAYPAPRCNISWLGGELNNKLPLTVPQATTIPCAAGKGFGRLRCLWAGYLWHQCLPASWDIDFAGGMIAPELDHLLELVGASQVVSAPQDALQRQATAGAAAEWSVTELAAALGARFGASKVVLLTDVPKLSSAVGPRHQTFLDKGLATARSKQHFECHFLYGKKPYRRQILESGLDDLTRCERCEQPYDVGDDGMS